MSRILLLLYVCYMHFPFYKQSPLRISKSSFINQTQSKQELCFLRKQMSPIEYTANDVKLLKIASFSTTVTLKIKSRSPKSNQFICPASMMYPCKFGTNPTTGSQDIAQTRKWQANTMANAGGTHTNNNMCPSSSVGGHNRGNLPHIS